MTRGGAFSTHALSASSVSPKLNSPPPRSASQPLPGGRAKIEASADTTGSSGPAQRPRRGDAELRRRLDDVDAGFAHRLDLRLRRSLAVGGDGAGLPHAAARW